MPATIFSLLSLAAPALAEPPSPGPAPSATAEEAWPWPPPDPKSWWDEKWPIPAEAADPLTGRRLGRGEPAIAIDNGYDPLLYRLWALPPLQNQILRGGEMILEVAIRPSTSARQSLIRVIVRRDGKAFVQARAGLGCCEPGIARRVGFDTELPAGSAAKFLVLRNAPLWDAPREVRVAEATDTADALCIDGTSYDLTIVVPGKSRSVRRACDSAEVGQAADVLEAALGAALGHEPRFDVIYPTGASFASARSAYQQLITDGGQLKPAPRSRPQPPTFQPPAVEEPSSAPTP